MRIKQLRTVRRIVLLTAAVALIHFAMVRVSAAAPPLATTTVSIDNFSFTPMTLTIAVGSQVVWINKDDVPHTIVSVDHQFKSKTLDTDEKFFFTFQSPGTYEYFCSVHPKMTGRIVVQ